MNQTKVNDIWIRYIPKFCSVNQELICWPSKPISPLNFSPTLSHFSVLFLETSAYIPARTRVKPMSLQQAGTSTAAKWEDWPWPAVFKGSCSNHINAEPILSYGLCSKVVSWYYESELFWVLRLTRSILRSDLCPQSSHYLTKGITKSLEVMAMSKRL